MATTSHGHVVPRPDGAKARCGGPAICAVCAKEAAQQQAPGPPLPPGGKYRKRPVVVDAARWDGSVPGATSVIDWVLAGGGTARYHEERATDTSETAEGQEVVSQRAEPVPAHIAVDTPDATGRVYPGDWVIRGAAGDHYPCRGDIFDATYEPVVAG